VYIKKKKVKEITARTRRIVDVILRRGRLFGLSYG